MIKFSNLILLILLFSIRVNSQHRTYSNAELSGLVKSKVDSVANKLYRLIVSGKIKSYLNDTTPVKLTDLGWFQHSDRPKGVQVRYNELSGNGLNQKIFEIRDVWLVFDLYTGGIKFSTQPFFSIKTEDIRLALTSEEYYMIQLFSGFLFSIDTDLNVLVDYRLEASKQDLIYRKIEQNLIEKVSYSLLDTISLTVLSNVFLSSISRKCVLFRRSNDSLVSNFFSDINLSRRISKDELDDLLRETYPYKTKTDTLIYSPFNFENAISITLSGKAIGFGYDNGFTLFMNKKEFIRILTPSLNGMLEIIDN